MAENEDDFTLMFSDLQVSPSYVATHIVLQVCMESKFMNKQNIYKYFHSAPNT